MSKEFNHCYPQCEFFRCSQKALNYQGRRAYCRWAEDDCSGATCNYAICIRERMLPNGVCGLTVKRKTDEITKPPEAEKVPEIKLRGKLLNRIKEEDIL